MANWLIVAVIVLRLLLKKVPRRVICVLWALVALRLMLPVSVESPVSMIPETTAILQEAVDTTLIHPEAVPSDGTPTEAQEGSGGRGRTANIPASIRVVRGCSIDAVLSAA